MGCEAFHKSKEPRRVFPNRTGREWSLARKKQESTMTESKNAKANLNNTVRELIDSELDNVSGGVAPVTSELEPLPIGRLPIGRLPIGR
jgi:hypothetical protein